MDQFRQIGKVVGSLNALMTFQDNMLNHKQCCLLVDTLASAYDTIADHMRKNLKFDERNTKWKIIEHPLKELVRVFKEGESYVRLCMDVNENSFFGKAFLLYQNSDCLELHLHNLLAAVPVAIEAIELAGQISGHDSDEIHKKRFVYSAKYGKDMRDPRIFRLVLGGQYLVSQDACTRMDSVWDEDRWHLLKKIKDMMKRSSSHNSMSKRDLKLADAFSKYLNGEYCNLTSNDVLLPISILVKDYQVRRRLGNGSHYKEIQWLGERFASRHFFGDVENLVSEISSELSLSHPNVLHTLCGFSDEERRECFLVMELMSRDLSGYIKEICGPRKRVPFSLPVAVDLMLQIARGMEYLHSKGIFHGELNPSNVLIRARSVSGAEGYLHAKVSGFGLSQKTPTTTSAHNINERTEPSFIWYAPEVLAEQEESSFGSKHTEKADVYSFGMICFEVLTGKVPFDELHLQGEKMSRNIRSGERPLFPFHSPKYVVSLTRKCWHADPVQRPSFSAVCRVLRYTKRFLSMNPEHDAVMPAVDLSELEGYFGGGGGGRVYEIPFEMFAYRVTEREKERGRERENSESGSDGASSSNFDFSSADDMFASPPGERNNSTYKTMPSSPEMMIRKLSLSTSKKNMEIKTGRQQTQPPGTPPNKGRSPTMMVSSRPPHTPNGGGRLMRKNSEGHLLTMSPKTRRRTGHASDTEFP